MNMYEIITKKKNKEKLSKDEIDFFVKGVTDGSIPDYQTSALLMAVCLNGMDDEETWLLTDAMTHSGDVLDLGEIKGIKVAQLMFVMGVGSDTTKNPIAEDNLRLALKIQQIADKVYPGLFKPMIIRNSVYNQDLNKYSLLIMIFITFMHL